MPRIDCFQLLPRTWAHWIEPNCRRSNPLENESNHGRLLLHIKAVTSKSIFTAFPEIPPECARKSNQISPHWWSVTVTGWKLPSDDCACRNFGTRLKAISWKLLFLYRFFEFIHKEISTLWKQCFFKPCFINKNNLWREGEGVRAPIMMMAFRHIPGQMRTSLNNIWWSLMKGLPAWWRKGWKLPVVRPFHNQKLNLMFRGAKMAAIVAQIASSFAGLLIPR